MNCPKCGYAMDALDTTCKRCKRIGPPAPPPPPQAPSVAVPAACSTCSLPLDSGETFCPRCMVSVASAGVASALPSDLFWIDADGFRPLEAFIWSRRGEKITEAQLHKQIEECGLAVEEHPIFNMVMAWPERDSAISCSHPSHSTPEKRDKCIRRQAIRVGIRTVRHHLGYLERLTFWAQPNSLMRHAMWTCIEQNRPACEVCRQREGIVIPVAVRSVPVIHPLCNCSLVQLMSGSEAAPIAKAASYLTQKAPGRSAMMLENAARSGFRVGGPTAAGCGATALLMLGALFVPIIIRAL